MKRLSSVEADDDDLSDLFEMANDLSDTEEMIRKLEEEEDLPPSAEELEAAWRQLPKDFPACGVCPRPSSFSMKDVTGFKHQACTVHYPYLEGWVQSNNTEAAHDAKASTRHEEEYR